MFDEEYGEAETDFFADADYGDISAEDITYDYDLGEGTHHVTITQDGPIDTSSGKTYIIKFTGDKSKSFTQFLNPIMPSDRDKTFGDTNLEDIKRRERVGVLTAIGVPQDKIRTLKPGQLTGIEGYLKLSKNKAGRMKFRGFNPTSGAVASSSASAPTAKPVPTEMPKENLSEFGI